MKKATKTSFAQFRACCAQFELTLSHWQNRMTRIKRWLSGLIRWIGHICCKQICRKFIHIVSCIWCTICADVFTLAKSRETHQKMAFRSNKMNWAHLLQKILQKFIHIVSCIRCTVCTAILPLSESCETHQNMSFGSNKKDWACSLQNNLQKVRLHSFLHPVHN